MRDRVAIAGQARGFPASIRRHLGPLWAVSAAFGAYFCMYAFRKPFTAASYAELSFLGIGFKTVLVASQVLGYTISKFIGIKVISEMPPGRRAATLLILIAIAELALIGFGLIAPPYNFLFLFINGLPLGMVFGLVLGFLEGRQLTEALTAGLCASFILADGVVKSVGAELLNRGVPQFWMPAAVGAAFVIPLLAFVWMLTQVPTPSAIDRAERSERMPLERRARWRLFSHYWPGLCAITFLFLMITILRSVRADFMPELWHDLGYAAPPSVFAQTEFWVAAGVTLINGLSSLIRRNGLAFFLSLAISLAGIFIIAIGQLGLQQKWIDPFWYVVLCGLGLYLPYVAVHTTVFERFLAITREPGNLGFLMYVADAFGYLGYVAVMLIPALISRPSSILSTFQTLTWVLIVLSTISLLAAVVYFSKRFRELPAVRTH